MKIIFLDFDGVLNHQLYYKERHQGDRYNDNPELGEANDIDPSKIELLNGLIQDTGAKVVVSSSWRTSFNEAELQDLLEKRGFTGKIIGRTPYLTFSTDDDRYDYSVPRGCEIKAWIEMNKGKIGDKMSKFKYVIFDDDSDMLYWQRNNFIWVDPFCGLTPSLIFKARKILAD